MIIINFSHPLTPRQRDQISGLTKKSITREIDLTPQFDHNQSFISQATDLINQISLRQEDWQGLPIILVLPSFNIISALLLAELHGRMGHFPTILRLKPVEGSIPQEFECAELINLQLVRDQSRTLR